MRSRAVVEVMKRLREPAAFVLLAAVTIRLLVASVQLVLVGTGAGEGSLASEASRLADWVLDPLTAVVLAVVVLSCAVWDRTRHARLLAVASLLVVALAVLTALVLGVVAIAAGTAGLSSGVVFLTDLLAPGVAALVLARVLRSDGVRAVRSSLQPPQESRSTALEEVPRRADETPPTWEPERAVGAAWQTAGDAAAGAAAAGWGAPGQTSGWTPALRPHESQGQAQPGPSPAGREAAPPGRGDAAATSLEAELSPRRQREDQRVEPSSEQSSPDRSGEDRRRPTDGGSWP